MTRAEFIADMRHQVMGVLTEGIERGRDSVAIATFLKWAYPKIDAILGKAFDEANPKPVTQNGAHNPRGAK